MEPIMRDADVSRTTQHESGCCPPELKFRLHSEFGSTPELGSNQKLAPLRTTAKSETMTPFTSQSRRLAGRVQVAAPIAQAFPLFSPLGEKAWVPGWDPELLHPSGANWTEGLIFRTRGESGDAIWVVTRLDRSAWRVQYHRVEPDLYVD